MRPTLRPRLLGHLRDMLAEKEQDIVTLRARLRASEELKGHALGRLELLEAQLSSLPPPGGDGLYDCTAAAQAAVHEAVQAAAHNEVAEQLRASQRQADHLRGMFAASEAGRRELAERLERSELEAEEARREAGALFEHLAALEEREAQLLQAREQASLLNQQLISREADVARLERRVYELEMGTPTVRRGVAEAAYRVHAGDGHAANGALEATLVQPRLPEACASRAVRPVEPPRSWRDPQPVTVFSQGSSSQPTASSTPRSNGRVACEYNQKAAAAPQQAPKLVSSSSAAELRIAAPREAERPRTPTVDRGDAAPQPPASPPRTGTVAPILNRSQSLPAPPANAGGSSRPGAGLGSGALRAAAPPPGGVSLARWAASPAPGTRVAGSMVPAAHQHTGSGLGVQPLISQAPIPLVQWERQRPAARGLALTRGLA